MVRSTHETFTKKFFLAGTILLALASPAAVSAKDKPQEKPQANPPAKPAQNTLLRYAIEAGAGLNFVSPYGHVRISYRLPIFLDKFDVFLDYAPYAKPGNDALPFQQTLALGSRFYFCDQGWFRPHALLLLGAAYHQSEPNFNGAFVQGGFDQAMFLIGLGTDLMLNENWGFNAQVLTGLGTGYFFRPEINLKFAF